MELGTFTPRERQDGDTFPAKEAVDRALVVLVKEHRTGIVTKFKPEGGDGVVVDAADVATNEVFLDVLWMNGAVVDNLAPFVAQAVPIKLVWIASAKGGNAYIGVESLDGPLLTQAQTWAAANAGRFDTERLQRAAQAHQPAHAPAGSIGAQALADVQAQNAAAATPPPAAPVAAPPAAAPAQVDVNSPEVQALLAQIAAGGQLPPKA